MFSVAQTYARRLQRLYSGVPEIEQSSSSCRKSSIGETMPNEGIQENDRGTCSRAHVQPHRNSGWPTGREPYGHRAPVVVRGRESRLHGEGGQVSSIAQNGEVREMREAETVLAIIRERGRRGLPLERVYRLLWNRDLFLLAYGRIAKNDGALTPGATNETADGMTLAKIDAIIEALRFERYRWTPVRRTYIEKKHSNKKRPLGIPTWSNKLVQEVMRVILEAYYEPQFSDRSHGFRRGRGCHTALSEVHRTWNGTRWFIEGDLSQFFDSLDHEVLVGILAEKIHDGRFLRLIKELLTAGYLEDWKFNTTFSGVPQGGVVSPVLSGIYLDRFDKWVETTLLPAYTRGAKRRTNPLYNTILHRAWQLARAGYPRGAAMLRKQAKLLARGDPSDAAYRRLRYVRYADDWLLGFIGPRSEAEAIKRQVGAFLHDTLKLELSEQKTLITHARTEAARFLGYEVIVLQDDTARTPYGRRRINGVAGLRVPADVVKQKCSAYMIDRKPVHRPERLHDSVFSIVEQYQAEYRGIVDYYRLAFNLHRFSRLKWVMETSLTKTLAAKLRISVAKVYKRYQAILQTPAGTYKGLRVTVEREGKPPLVAQWGGVTLKHRRDAVLSDQPRRIWNDRTDLEQRLLADECELCGSHKHVEVHHVRSLKSLKNRGRAEKPAWVKAMVARQRKTLIVCRTCHMDIQHGRPPRRVRAA
jgi:group II intron reverse transcriptase/maturase